MLLDIFQLIPLRLIISFLVELSKRWFLNEDALSSAEKADSLNYCNIPYRYSIVSVFYRDDLRGILPRTTILLYVGELRYLNQV